MNGKTIFIIQRWLEKIILPVLLIFVVSFWVGFGLYLGVTSAQSLEIAFLEKTFVVKSYIVVDTEDDR